MRHVDYDKWTDKILSIYKNHTNRPLQDILELACGTASISERLVAQGYIVTASDRSEEMIKAASLKQHKPVLLHADMTSPLKENAYDLVIIVFDSINYLTDKEDISRLFTNVYQGLRPDGLFIFDISTYRNSMDNFSDYLNLDEAENYLLIHRADFDPEKRLQSTKLTIFRQVDKLYEKLEEEHQQRIYSVHDLIDLCDKSPLDCVGIYNLAYDKNLLKTNVRRLDHQYSRLFWALKKGLI
jgi:SAM-dependent methyltransferase